MHNRKSSSIESLAQRKDAPQKKMSGQGAIRLFLLIFGLCGIASPFPIVAQQGFEGVVTMSMSATNPAAGYLEGKMQLMISKLGVRVEAEVVTPNGEKPVKTVIITLAKSPEKMVMIYPDMKTYTEFDFSQFKTQIEQMAGEMDPNQVTIERVGSEKVGNFQAQHIIIGGAFDSEKTEMWIADNVLTYDTFLNSQIGPLRVQMDAYGAALKKNGYKGFPVKIKNPAIILEVKSIETKKIPPAVYNVPKGFSKREMGFGAGVPE